MGFGTRARRAPGWGALFRFLALLTWGTVIVGPASLRFAVGSQIDCRADRIDAWARVAFVYDGDTVKLSDGRKVRFLGINTPETGRKGKPSQPFSNKARTALQRMLAPSQMIGLRYDKQKRDKYDRLLAHVYIDDETNVSARLLQQGLAATLVVPPNTWNIDCYAAVEQQARRVKKGIWRLPAYHETPATSLDRQTRGFYIVAGKVQRVGYSRHALWLNLNGGLALRISEEDLGYFSGLRLESRSGQTIKARGWIRRYGGKLQMRVRHPASLEVAD